MTPPGGSPCPYCGSAAAPVHVHGHAQCADCGLNIEPCCDGASATDDMARYGNGRVVADPDLFVRLFTDRLGGVAATVTDDALLYALVEYESTDLDGARLLIEAGEHTGALARVGDGCHRLRRRRRRDGAP